MERQPSVRGAVAACTGAFTGIFVISIFLNLLTLTGPLYMLQVYDRVLASSSVPTLLVLSGFALALYVLAAALDLLRARALSRISLRVYMRLSERTLAAALRLPLLGGSRVAGVSPQRDLEAIRRFLGSGGPAALCDAPFMPFYFALIFMLHPLMGQLAVAGGAVILVLVIANEFASRAPARKLAQTMAAQGRFHDGARRNAEVVGALGMTSRVASRSAALASGFADAQNTSADRSLFFGTSMRSLRMILQSAMLGLGAWLVIRHEVSAGAMIASSVIMARAVGPIEQAVAQWPAFIAARQGAERLDRVLADMAPARPLPGLPVPRRELKVTELYAAPPGEAGATLHNLNFELKAGDALGVVGPSGAGKTNLARTLVGVWLALRGSIRLDGATLSQWTEDERAQIVGYLPQDVELFDGTIADNISRFSADADMTAIVEAAQQAGVHQMITSLAQGYGTRIGESGQCLSAGQRQRVALARALYGAPFLIVLDEPNSNLDAEGEHALAKAIMSARQRGAIVVVIAHRPNVLSTVNKILQLRDGQQVAFGDRDQIAAAAVQQMRSPGKVVANAV
ncbi:MAG: type I secretion system permease/ATPase [Defluviimonas sp.]|nr:type I secretion system permease/ATPase [Defluviimonas sp.]